MGLKFLKGSILGATKGTEPFETGVLRLSILSGDMPGGKRTRTQTIMLFVGCSTKEVSSVIAAQRKRERGRGRQRERGRERERKKARET